QTSGVVTLRSQLRLESIRRCATRPLCHHTIRVFEERAHGIPDVPVELIDAHLTILADASTGKSVAVSTNASIVAVTGLAFCGGRRDELSIEGVAAYTAHSESL